MKKEKGLLGLVLIALLVFSVAWVGVLDKNDQHMNGKWTFWNDVQLKEDLDVDLTLTVDGASTLTGNVTASGDVAVAGSVTIADELVLEVYTHASGDGALTWDTAYGNVLLTSGATTSAIALPKGTAAMDGYILITKNISGANARTFTPNATTAPADTIESTRGTMTGTTDATQDAAGDAKAWMYDDKGSATSGVWTQLWVNQT